MKLEEKIAYYFVAIKPKATNERKLLLKATTPDDFVALAFVQDLATYGRKELETASISGPLTRGQVLREIVTKQNSVDNVAHAISEGRFDHCYTSNKYSEVFKAYLEAYTCARKE